MTALVKAEKTADVYELLLADFISLERLFSIAYKSQQLSRIIRKGCDIDGMAPRVYMGLIREKIIAIQGNGTYYHFLNQREIQVAWHSLLNCLEFLEEITNYPIIESNIEHLEEIIDELQKKFN